MAKLELAIDIGSSYLTIYQKGKGVVIKEPNIAIVNNNGKVEVLELGEKALSLLGRADRRLKSIYPVSEGAVVYPEVFATMVKKCISRLITSRIFKPQVSAIVLVSQCLNELERKTIENTMYEAGIKEVVLVDAPLAVYVDNECRPGMYVDVGADLTDVSIITSAGIMSGYTVNIGGNVFNNQISDRITNKYGVRIGKYTAEKIKKTIGSMYSNDVNVDEVMGINIINDEKTVVDVNAGDILQSINGSVDLIVDVINTTINMCPAELAKQIVDDGIYISGGSTLLPGFEEYLIERTKINVKLLDNITTAVCIGGGKLIDNPTLLNNLLRLKNI